MIPKHPVALTHQFEYALDQLNSPQADHLLITGKAGTGKSTLLRLFRQTTDRKVVYLAPTGIAALHIRGQTIHSFFKLPPKIITKDEILARRKSSIYRKIDLMIIDEISMVRADLLDTIDLLLRHQRNDPRPFGGVQTAFFGDIFQLPPVLGRQAHEIEYLRARYEGLYFFDSHVWASLPRVEAIELTTVFRQKEKRYLRILEQIRYNDMDYEAFTELNSRVNPNPPQQNIITLSPRRNLVQQINNQKLMNLEGEPRIYTARVKGQVNIRQMPAEENLLLKNGAQVLFVKNDAEKRYVNGSLGRVIQCDTDTIQVALYDEGKEQIIDVTREDWEILKYKVGPEPKRELTTEIIGTYTQFPLKLAWAMTIHKSQGMTFDQVIVDMGGGAFESGQTYVALSRCRSFGGLYLKKPIQPRDIQLDPRLIEFQEDLR